MSYTIAPDGGSITCHRCGRTSYNLDDIMGLYCGACHRFHEDGGLPIWTVYDHPTDLPCCFVARMFRFERPTTVVMIEPTLDALRDRLAALGLVPLMRDSTDDPKIVETWI
jgi:hypothetical protein